MANEFRTVQYRGSDVQRNAYVGVPNGQQALDSDINYQSKQLQRSSEALLQQEAATIQNNKRIDAISLDNQRLQLEAMNSRNNAVLKNEQLFGEQRLNNMKLREDQSQQIRELQIVHKQKSDELKLINQRQENESITQFGAQMLQFSKTLWEQNVKEQQKKAEEMSAQATIDYALNPNLGELLRVDQAKYGRLAKQGEASLLAAQLEKQGLPNDAARIRANNPFYLHTMQEMAALTSVQELPQYLHNVVQEAHKKGTLVWRDGDYSMKLQMIQYDALKVFLTEKGLSKMNPVIVARYLQGPMLDALSGVSKQFNAENNKLTKEGAKNQAIGAALAAFPTLSDPVTADLHIQEIFQQGGGESAVREFLEGAFAQARLSENNSPIVTLMQNERMQPYLGLFAEFDHRRIREAEATLKQKNQETYNHAVSEFKIQVSEANPADIPRLRDQALEKYQGVLAPEHYVQFMDMVKATKMTDAGFLQTRVGDAISSGRTAIGNMLRNPNITSEQKQELQKAYDEANKLVMSEQHKEILQHAQNLVLGRPATKLKSSGKLMNPLYAKSIDAVIKQRQDKLQQIAEQWLINNPGASVKDFQTHMAAQTALTESEIVVDQHGRIPELGVAATIPDASRSVPPNSRVAYKGRQVTFMLNTATRAAVMRGDYGWIDGGNSVLVTEDEIRKADDQFRDTGIYPPLIYSLSTITRSANPTAFLESQARLHGGSGTASPPPTQTAGGPQTNVGQPGTPITRAHSQRLALNAGLSQRGAIWFASNIFSESGGDPTKTHDSGAGYGLFGHQGSRLAALRARAVQRGVDISDANMQAQFALEEVKAQKAVWDIVSAPNPSLNDLYRASKLFFGFDEEHKAGDGRLVKQVRFDNLRRDLGE